MLRREDQPSSPVAKLTSKDEWAREAKGCEKRGERKKEIMIERSNTVFKIK